MFLSFIVVWGLTGLVYILLCFLLWGCMASTPIPWVFLGRNFYEKRLEITLMSYSEEKVNMPEFPLKECDLVVGEE